MPWEVNLSMTGRLSIERKMHPSFFIIKERKSLMLKHLENAVDKLKEARAEIRKVVQATMEMGITGDEMANKVVSTVSDMFAGSEKYWIFKDNIKELLLA